MITNCLGVRVVTQFGELPGLQGEGKFYLLFFCIYIFTITFIIYCFIASFDFSLHHCSLLPLTCYWAAHCTRLIAFDWYTTDTDDSRVSTTIQSQDKLVRLGRPVALLTSTFLGRQTNREEIPRRTDQLVSIHRTRLEHYHATFKK